MSLNKRKILCLKTLQIPKVVSLGFNVLFDIIHDSYQTSPQICVRSLQSLFNLLKGLKPESFKHEPSEMIDKMFELIISLIELSLSSMDSRKFSLTSTANLYDNYHYQVLELGTSCLLSLSLARGDTARMLICIRTLLMQCDLPWTKATSMEDSVVMLDNYSLKSKPFTMAIPDIMILLKKHVTSYLLGKHSLPEWCHHGFSLASLADFFVLQFQYHQNSSHRGVLEYEVKLSCPTSLTFDGQYLYLFRCNRVHLIGSGYSDTVRGVELYSCQVDVSGGQSSGSSFSPYRPEKSVRCCAPGGGWIGFVGGELFLQANNRNWSLNQIAHLDSKSFKVKGIVPLISSFTKSTTDSNPFQGPTLCTTDGDHLLLLTAQQNDCFELRELKPFKINMDSKSSCKEKLSFSLSTEITVRMSSICMGLCGGSMYDLYIPSSSFNHQNPGDELQFESSNKSAQCLTPIDVNNLCEMGSVSSIATGKDFALILTDQGKVYFTGNPSSLGKNSIDEQLFIIIFLFQASVMFTLKQNGLC